VLANIRKLRELAESTGSPALFEADGAIRDQTVPELIEAATDILCCGSIVFRQPDPRAAIGRLKGLPPCPACVVGPKTLGRRPAARWHAGRGSLAQFQTRWFGCQCAPWYTNQDLCLTRHPRTRSWKPI
jgi:hypothetical protein